MPLVTFLFVGADRIVPLLLGDQCGESVTLFHALALAAFNGPVAHGPAGLAAGGFCFLLMYIGVWSALPGGRRSLRDLLKMASYLR